jgi:hypothetical protein
MLAPCRSGVFQRRGPNDRFLEGSFPIISAATPEHRFLWRVRDNLESLKNECARDPMVSNRRILRILSP